MKTKIYYSHSMKIYHSDREKEELELIKQKFPEAEIFNPSDYQEEWEDLSGQAIMEKCLNQVLHSDIVAFSAINFQEHANKWLARNLQTLKEIYTPEERKRFHVGRGVFDEVKLAERNFLQIYYITDSKLKKNYTIKLHNENDWSFMYGTVKKKSFRERMWKK